MKKTWGVGGSILLMILAVWLLLRPFSPYFSTHIKRITKPQAFTQSYYENRYPEIETTDEPRPDQTNKRGVPVDEPTNRLIIPSIGVDILLIQDEDQDRALSKGAWVVPGSASPEENGQMVITGHRFEILPPAQNTFYNLDKLKEGAAFFLIVDGYRYTYLVRETQVVEAEDFYLDENLTDKNEVVLYTCTPLWTAAKRLLVFAESR